MIRKPRIASDSHILGKINIKPDEEVDFIVGVYEEIIPQPQLNLDFEPQQKGGIQASLVRIDGNGDYTLIYHFANHGKGACEVTVRVSWPEQDTAATVFA